MNLHSFKCGYDYPYFPDKRTEASKVNKLLHVIKVPQDGPKFQGLSFETELGTNPSKIDSKKGYYQYTWELGISINNHPDALNSDQAAASRHALKCLPCSFQYAK